MKNVFVKPSYTLDWIVYERLLYLKFMDTVTLGAAALLNAHLTPYLELSQESEINLVLDTSALKRWDITAIDAEAILTALFHDKVRWIILVGQSPWQVTLSLSAISNVHGKRFRVVNHFADAKAFLYGQYRPDEFLFPV